MSRRLRDRLQLWKRIREKRMLLDDYIFEWSKFYQWRLHHPEFNQNNFDRIYVHLSEVNRLSNLFTHIGILLRQLAQVDAARRSRLKKITEVLLFFDHLLIKRQRYFFVGEYGRRLALNQTPFDENARQIYRLIRRLRRQLIILSRPFTLSTQRNEILDVMEALLVDLFLHLLISREAVYRHPATSTHDIDFFYTLPQVVWVHFNLVAPDDEEVEQIEAIRRKLAPFLSGTDEARDAPTDIDTLYLQVRNTLKICSLIPYAYHLTKDSEHDQFIPYWDLRRQDVRRFLSRRQVQAIYEEVHDRSLNTDNPLFLSPWSFFYGAILWNIRMLLKAAPLDYHPDKRRVLEAICQESDNLGQLIENIVHNLKDSRTKRAIFNQLHTVTQLLFSPLNPQDMPEETSSSDVDSVGPHPQPLFPPLDTLSTKQNIEALKKHLSIHALTLTIRTCSAQQTLEQLEQNFRATSHWHPLAMMQHDIRLFNTLIFRLHDHFHALIHSPPEELAEATPHLIGHSPIGLFLSHLLNLIHMSRCSEEPPASTEAHSEDDKEATSHAPLYLSMFRDMPALSMMPYFSRHDLSLEQSRFIFVDDALQYQFASHTLKNLLTIQYGCDRMEEAVRRIDALSLTVQKGIYSTFRGHEPGPPRRRARQNDPALCQLRTHALAEVDARHGRFLRLHRTTGVHNINVWVKERNQLQFPLFPLSEESREKIIDLLKKEGNRNILLYDTSLFFHAVFDCTNTLIHRLHEWHTTRSETIPAPPVILFSATEPGSVLLMGMAWLIKTLPLAQLAKQLHHLGYEKQAERLAAVAERFDDPALFQFCTRASVEDTLGRIPRVGAHPLFFIPRIALPNAYSLKKNHDYLNGLLEKQGLALLSAEDDRMTLLTPFHPPTSLSSLAQSASPAEQFPAHSPSDEENA